MAEVQTRIFVSHSSEDKARFVEPLCTELRKCGFDVWLDKWEMQSGDSLVDRIYEEGLGTADIVLGVLSEKSLQSAWVKDALSTAKVLRIVRGIRVIPVVLDDCEVPVALLHYLWHKVEQPSDIENETLRLVAQILRTTDKPELGVPPKLLSTQVIPGLNTIDSATLRWAGDSVLSAKSYNAQLPVELLEKALASEELPLGELLKSVRVLGADGYVDAVSDLGKGVIAFKLTVYGFREYAATCLDDYSQVRDTVLGLLINEKVYSSSELAKRAAAPHSVVRHILDEWAASDLIKLTTNIGWTKQVWNVSPKLERLLPN